MNRKQDGPSLREAFALKDRGVISIVGAGGKTSLMFSLACELAATGARVLTTTTTKILMPTEDQSPCVVLADSFDEFMTRTRPRLEEHRHITAAASLFDGGRRKLVGFEPELIDAGWKSGCFDWIIVEADGAFRRPLKAPEAHEPVIPRSSSVVIGVAGLTVVGRPLGDDWVFRPDRVAQITGLAPGDAVTIGAVGDTLTHASGIFKNSPPSAARHAYLNMAGDFTLEAQGLRIADYLRGCGRIPLERVVTGHAAENPHVVSWLRL